MTGSLMKLIYKAFGVDLTKYVKYVYKHGSCYNMA